MGRLRSILREYSVDRFGAAIFFGSLCFTGLYWQVGVFINDNYTIVNTLLNLSEGRLYFESFYGSELVKWPGTVHIDDRLYGRSYGIAFAALPFLWATTLLEPILGLRLIAVGFWSVGVLGLAVQIDALVGRRRSVLLAACTLIGSVVVANALLTSPTDINRIHRYVLSLQMLAILASVFVSSLVPFFITNTITTGDPFTSPLMASGFGVDTPTSAGGETGAGGGGAGGGASGSADGVGGLVPDVLITVIDRVMLVVSIYRDGLIAVADDPYRVYQVFIDRAYTAPNFGSSRNLTVLESMPFLGVLVGVIPYGIYRVRRGPGVRSWLRTVVGQTDALVFAYVLLFAIVYMPRLPLRVQLTVRYLVPITPGLLYLTFRLPPVKRAIRTNQSALSWTYAFGLGGFSLASLLLLRAGSAVGITASDLDLLSLHGSVALGCATFLGIGTIAAVIADDARVGTIVARLFALGAALGTTLILLFFLHYSPAERWLFPPLP